ncbi:MAG: DUF3800 domain-containing protein [Pseudonocardiaceae bacterium]
MYADETGNLDYQDQPGSSTYFGVGTALFTGDHGTALGQGLRLRAELAANGLNLRRGFHDQGPRFDTTFLYKQNAYESVRQRGQVYLYKTVWYQHFKVISNQVTQPGDRLFVVVATLGTNKRRVLLEQALHEVCVNQGPVARQIVLCHWDSATSWGLQVADYGLWAVQRLLERGVSPFYPSIEPTLRSIFTPWGKLASTVNEPATPSGERSHGPLITGSESTVANNQASRQC